MRALEGIIKFAEAVGIIKPPLGEIGSTASQLLSKWDIKAYNPDDLVRSKAAGLRIYQDMLREPYIKAALMQKKANLLSVPWEIQPASNDARDVEIAAFVKWNLRTNIKGSFNRDLYEALDALDNGFSVSEKVFGICEKGPYKGKIVYETIKSKDPYYFDFALDDFGNIKHDGLICSETADGKSDVKLPVDKFFIFSYAMRYENPYGNSDLRAVYRAYWIKDTAWKLRSIYMERFAGNHLKGTYPRNDEKAKEKLLEIFRTWQQETGIALPEGVDIEVIKLAASSDSEYARAISDLNKEMLIGVLGETLTVDEGQKTGARSMGEIHQDVAELFVFFLDIILTADVNEQIVQPLVDYNFADVVNYPRWQFDPRQSFRYLEFAKALQTLQGLGVKLTEEYVRKVYKIPLPGNNETVLIPAAAPAKDPEKPTPGERKETEIDLRDKKDKFAEGQSTSKGDGYRRELNRFEKFAEIPRVDRRLRMLLEKSKEKSGPLYMGIFDSVLEQVRDRKIFDTGDIEEAARIVIKPTRLKAHLFKSFLAADMMARADVVTETQNQGFEFKGISKFAEVEFDWRVLEDPLTPEQAVKYFSGKVPMTKEAFGALTDRLGKNAFYVAGLEKLNIEKDVKLLLMDALKNGMSQKEFEFKLSEKAIKYATPVYGREGTVGEKMLDYHAETVFRNNMMSSYNEGRREMYADPDVKEFFPAFIYSAIMDGRETDICAELDGNVYMADDPVVQTYWPPNHNLCRSTFVSINKYDFTRDMLSEKPRRSPAEGFGG